MLKNSAVDSSSFLSKQKIKEEKHLGKIYLRLKTLSDYPRKYVPISKLLLPKYSFSK